MAVDGSQQRKASETLDSSWEEAHKGPFLAIQLMVGEKRGGSENLSVTQERRGFRKLVDWGLVEALEGGKGDGGDEVENFSLLSRIRGKKGEGLPNLTNKTRVAGPLKRTESKSLKKKVLGLSWRQFHQ